MMSFCLFLLQMEDQWHFQQCCFDCHSSSAPQKERANLRQNNNENFKDTQRDAFVWRNEKRKWNENKAEREKEERASPGTWPCIVPQAFEPRTCYTPLWLLTLCRTVPVQNCTTWPVLTPGLSLSKSLSVAVGEPHPHSQACGILHYSSSE